MPSVRVESVDPTWCYEFVPSSALPSVDLSRSVKSHFFSGRALRALNSVVRRFLRPMVYSHILGQICAGLLGFFPAPSGRIVAVFVLVMVVPSYLVNISSMRLEIVRLVLREDSVVFLCVVNAITNSFIGVVFSDLRALAAVTNFIGWINVLVIDAQLVAIRDSIRFIAFAMAVVSSLTVCVFLGRIDQVHGVTLWQYKDGDSVYNVPATDYVVNGLSTFFILLFKIVYRKRESIRHGHENNTIKCVVLQCRTKLVPYASQRVIVSKRGPNSAAATAHIQQLQFVSPKQIYDVRRIVFPVTIASKTPFPRPLLLLLYALGWSGFGLWILSSAFVNRRSNGDATTVNNQIARETAVTMAAFGCSVGFCLVFIACYQRELLRTLILSFDFVFYSVQATAIHLVAGVLYDWQRDYCVWLVTCWIWMHWVFCLDALTPLMKAKLWFHVHYALPVAAVLLMGMALLVLGILIIGMNPPKGRTIWTGVVLGRSVSLKVLPFFVTRLFFMLSWMLRLVIRLWKASNADAVILHGCVQYENYLFKGGTRAIKPMKSDQVQPSEPVAR